MTRGFWSLMQDIESMRHLAEHLETRAATIPSPRSDVYIRLAAQLRETAEIVHEMSVSEGG